MSQAEFETYFERRAGRFARFYRSEAVASLLGRGALFARLRGSVDIVSGLGATRVLDVGCGSGPLFAPLAQRGVRVTGIDPAPAMVAMARAEAASFGDLVTVEERGWESIDERDAYDVAVALGVLDYVDDAPALVRRLARAATHVVASYPAPGLRLRLRQVRYGARGVHVHGYTRRDLETLAADCDLVVETISPLGRAGFLAHFRRTGS
jgi:SAM-dependent methyltransferase